MNKELEEAAKKHATGKSSSPVFQAVHTLDFIAGAKWQQEQAKKMYSEEEVMDMFDKFSMHLPLHYEFLVKEQFKKK
jgi:hypothetical protein